MKCADDARDTVLLVSSSGGVLLELIALDTWSDRHRPVWAAVHAADTDSLLMGRDVRWISDLSARRPLALLPALFRAAQLLRRIRPQLLVSAGSGPAVPFFLLAAMRGIPSFWISTLNVSEPGTAARICARLASRVLVQRPAQLSGYPGAVLLGELY